VIPAPFPTSGSRQPASRGGRRIVRREQRAPCLLVDFLLEAMGAADSPRLGDCRPGVYRMEPETRPQASSGSAGKLRQKVVEYPLAPRRRNPPRRPIFSGGAHKAQSVAADRAQIWRAAENQNEFGNPKPSRQIRTGSRIDPGEIGTHARDASDVPSRTSYFPAQKAGFRRRHQGSDRGDTGQKTRRTMPAGRRTGGVG
jgi:hypothetical protein